MSYNVTHMVLRRNPCPTMLVLPTWYFEETHVLQCYPRGTSKKPMSYNVTHVVLLRSPCPSKVPHVVLLRNPCPTKLPHVVLRRSPCPTMLPTWYFEETHVLKSYLRGTSKKSMSYNVTPRGTSKKPMSYCTKLPHVVLLKNPCPTKVPTWYF